MDSEFTNDDLSADCGERPWMTGEVMQLFETTSALDCELFVNDCR